MIRVAGAFKAQKLYEVASDARPKSQCLAFFTCRLTTCMGSCFHLILRIFVGFATCFTFY
jgi:hypothetical protein